MSAAPSPETETIRIVTEVEIHGDDEACREHAIASALDRISIDFLGGMRGSSYGAKSIGSRLESKRDELAAIVRDVNKAFPDLHKWERGDGTSLAPLAARIKAALGG